MGKKIAFTTDDATGVSKGVKRLRGDSRNKPEVKRYNPFNVTTLAQSFDFYNISASTIPSANPAFMPFPLLYPNTGDGPMNRIGARIYLKYLRIKGFINMMNRMVCPVRWRLCLVRVDFNVDVVVTINQNWYLNHFLFVDTTAMTTASSVQEVLSWSRHNFYKKVKDVNDQTFKRKVIASGFFPALNNHITLEGQLAGTLGNQALTATFEQSGYNSSHAQGIAGYVPLDVTVKLFDNVDCARNLRRYYLVFEADNCVGYDSDLNSEVGRLASATVHVNAQALAYFTDA